MDVRTTGEESTVGQTAAHNAPSGAGRAGKCPDVTVIIPVYNAEGYLERCIGSVLNQTLGTQHIQCIAVDDGSTDGSGTVLDRLAADNPCLEVFHQPNSGGPAAPRNFALQHARGRYLFFLDQDDYLAEDALAGLVRAADTNETDVVLGRMKGCGGRAAPMVMFTRTVPRTTIFASAAYWTLSPIKLFRTELIRRLGLHFDEDFRVHEDIGFVTEAFVRANGITILSDRDYVYWTNRDDGSNITLSRMKMADRLPGVTHIFDLLSSLVPPGPQRDPLMRRLFEVETMSLCRAYREDPDSSLRPETFAVLRRIVAAYYTPEIDRVFVPHGRILFGFVSRDEPQEFLEYLDALAADPGPYQELVEDDHVYLWLPWFRDGSRGIPDDLYDIAPALNVFSRLEPLRADHRKLHVDVACRLGVLTGHVTSVQIVRRRRGADDEAIWDLDFEPSSAATGALIHADGDIPLKELLAAPHDVPHDLYLRVSAGPVSRERRLGECAKMPKTRLLRTSVIAGPVFAGLLTASPKADLTVTPIGWMDLARHLWGRVRRGIARRLRRLFVRS